MERYFTPEQQKELSEILQRTHPIWRQREVRLYAARNDVIVMNDEASTLAATQGELFDAELPYPPLEES